MQELHDEARAFSARHAAMVTDATQRAALQILCGIGLEHALEASADVKDAIMRRVERALKAERIKGLRRHWSYDLNRHIALKQALDRLRS